MSRIRTIRTITIMAAAAAALTAAACSEGSPTAAGGGDDELHLGVVVLTSGHPFYQSYARAWEDLAEEEGFELTLLDSQSKVDVQQQNVDDLLNSGVDGIAISAVDAASAQAAVNQAAGQDVPVTTVAVEVEDAPFVIEGAYDAGFAGGEAAGQWVQENHPEWQVRMAIVDLPSLQQTVDRADGFVAGVQSVLPDAEVVARQDGGGVLDRAQSVAENMIQAHSDANVWFGINDDSALGALNALRGAGRGTSDQTLVVGFDGSEQALRELLDPTSALKVEVGNLPRDYARMAYETVSAQASGEEPAAENTVPVEILTADTPPADVEEYFSTQYGGELDGS